ncbi:CD209 antigen-like protein C [Cynoglossus semilaevis]|uniref:CD209 antigen-like protein C n=1 Tax=Cynoglossus semilaevis TaxID=244447 RepID=UPI0007DC96B2|nr:CD209 antigen-like protein C [Cynoglossus semilaevis]
MNYMNQSATSSGGQSSKNHDDGVGPVKSGKTLLRLIGVSFGLLCILQAALNVSLRLVHSHTNGKTSPVEGSCKNLTEDIDNLKTALLHINHQEWVYFQCSYYYISNIKKSWQDSRDDCLKRGADLVIINSKGEHDFTRKLFGSRWIGLSDTDGNRTWMWVDGTPLSQSYWGSGEPNNSPGKAEECVEITFDHEEKSWNDLPCSSKTFWICEKIVAL